MDQRKIGSFLKELRKEKGITQEEFAEKLNVSGRSVSRWETGTNMPDISLLIEIAEFFDVSIPEIINGERKSESMNEEVREVADKLSDYANAEKEKLIKNIRSQSIMGTIAIVVYGVLEVSGAMARSAVFESIASYCQALAMVTVLMTMAYTSGLMYKLEKRKNTTPIAKLPKVIQFIILMVIAICVAAMLKLFLSNVLGW